MNNDEKSLIENGFGSFNIVIEISEHLFTRGKISSSMSHKILSKIEELIKEPGTYKIEFSVKHMS